MKLYVARMAQDYEVFRNVVGLGIQMWAEAINVVGI